MPAMSVTCANCRRRGHGIEKCRTRTRAHTCAPPKSKLNNACFNCNQEGDYSRQCPLPRKGGSRPPSSEAQNTTNEQLQHPKVSHVKDNDVTTNAVYLPATLGKIKLNCLLDSGCDVAIMPAKLNKEGREETNEGEKIFHSFYISFFLSACRPACLLSFLTASLPPSLPPFFPPSLLLSLPPSLPPSKK